MGLPPFNSGTLHLYRQLWKYAQGARIEYAFAMLLLAGAIVLKLLIPWLAAQAINTVQVSGSADLHSAASYVALIFLVYVAAWSMHGPGRILERHVSLRVRRQVADAIYMRLASLPLAWHESHHSGEVQQRAQQSAHALFDFTQCQFLYVQSFVNIVGPLVALWIVSGWVGALAFVGYVAIGSAILRFDIKLMRLASAENDAERRYTAMLLDFLGNIATLFSLRLADASRKRLAERLDAVFEPVRRSIVLNEGKWCAVDLLSAALTWILVAAYAALTHQVSESAGVPVLLGGLFMVYQYAHQAGGVIGSLAQNFQSFARMRTDFASAEPIWAATPSSASSGEVPRDWSRIEAHGLTHTYVRGNGELGGVLDATFTVNRGERIALVGASGSGKSTLLRVIAGLYGPSHGFYKIDGSVGFGIRSLASATTFVPQDAETFQATLRENLALGTEESEAAIIDALYVSALDTVVSALPEGLATPISERGFNLSGGQRQRLALARGFLAAARDGQRHGSLLLLDEPTSALDQMTEAKVFRRLRERMPRATIVASIHRMSALREFDAVILMAHGRIVDYGTVDSLFARQPAMRELMQHGSDALAGVA